MLQHELIAELRSISITLGLSTSVLSTSVFPSQFSYNENFDVGGTTNLDQLRRTARIHTANIINE